MYRILAFTLFAAASAQVFYDGPCPQEKPMDNFDFSAVSKCITMYPHEENHLVLLVLVENLFVCMTSKIEVTSH